MKDFLLHNNDLVIQDGDFVIDDSDKQHQERLLLLEKGNSKEFPDMGVGLKTFLESEDMNGLLREIKIQFTSDGMEVREIKVNNNGTILINADYV